MPEHLEEVSVLVETDFPVNLLDAVPAGADEFDGTVNAAAVEVFREGQAGVSSMRMTVSAVSVASIVSGRMPEGAPGGGFSPSPME